MTEGRPAANACLHLSLQVGQHRSTPRGVITAVLDTGRQLQEESRFYEPAADLFSLHETNRRLVAFVRLGIALQGTFQLDEIHDLTVNALAECGLCSIVLIRDGGRVLARLSFPQVDPLDDMDLSCNGSGEIMFSPDDPALGNLLQVTEVSHLADPMPVIGRVLTAYDLFSPVELHRHMKEIETQEAIAVPISGGGAPMGLIVLWGKEWSREDIRSVALVADQVSAAVEHAHFMQALRAEQEQLRTLAARLMEVQERERREMMRTLHDRVAQNLSAVGINLSLVKAQMSRTSMERVGARVDEIMSQVEHVTEDVRRVMADLHPPVLDDYGLVTALRWYGAQFSIESGIEVQIRESEPLPRLIASVEIALFRIVQEALANVARNGRASQIFIMTEVRDGLTRLILSDNAGGYGLISTTDCDDDPGATLLRLGERAEAIGGRCRIEVGSGRNIQFVVEVA